MPVKRVTLTTYPAVFIVVPGAFDFATTIAVSSLVKIWLASKASPIPVMAIQLTDCDNYGGEPLNQVLGEIE